MLARNVFFQKQTPAEARAAFGHLALAAILRSSRLRSGELAQEAKAKLEEREVAVLKEKETMAEERQRLADKRREMERQMAALEERNRDCQAKLVNTERDLQTLRAAGE